MKQESSKEAVDSIFFWLGLACILPLRVGSFFPVRLLQRLNFCLPVVIYLRELMDKGQSHGSISHFSSRTSFQFPDLTI